MKQDGTLQAVFRWNHRPGGLLKSEIREQLSGNKNRHYPESGIRFSNPGKDSEKMLPFSGAAFTEMVPP